MVAAWLLTHAAGPASAGRTDVVEPLSSPGLTLYLPLVASEVALRADWALAGSLGPPPWPEEDPFPLWHLATAGDIAYGLHIAVTWDGAEQRYGGHLLTIDLADAANPRWLGRSETLPLGGLGGNHRFYTVPGGNRAYVVASTAGLHVLDVADPLRPRFLATVPGERSVNAVQVHGSLAYVADTCTERARCPTAADGAVGNLRILDLADPGAPRELGRLALMEPALDLALGAGQVFVTGGEDGVLAVDVLDAGHPRLLAAYGALSWAERLALRGTQLVALQVQAPPLREPPALTRLDVREVAQPVVQDRLPLRALGLDAAKADELVLGDGQLLVNRADHHQGRWAIDWFDLGAGRGPWLRHVFWSGEAWSVPAVGLAGDTLLVAERDLRLFRLMPAEIPRP